MRKPRKPDAIDEAIARVTKRMTPAKLEEVADLTLKAPQKKAKVIYWNFD